MHVVFCRTHPNDPLPAGIAVGPWHVLGHIAQCQQQYGARYMQEMGLTFGDNVEHLWAEIRGFAKLAKYMSPASRQAYIQDLVSVIKHVIAQVLCSLET